MGCHIVYFSPTYSTRDIVRRIGGEFADKPQERDITNTCDSDLLMFDNEDIVIVGIPVYSGRVPKLAHKALTDMKGKDTPVILIATFGNRDYDDALLELKTMVEANGFKAIAAAAFVTEHSIVPKYGAGRPDEEDIRQIDAFAVQAKDKWEKWSAADHTDLPISGNPEYRAYQTLPIRPHATSACTACGLCAAQCPAGAIPADRPKTTDKDRCITCVRCIRICPQKARKFSGLERFMAAQSLKKKCAGYKKPAIFI